SADMQGCSYKTFMNCKPHSFNGTEGVVGLKRWFEKMEQVFEICKCTKDDKVKFAMCTLEGRALTWWNRNVQTLGLANVNQIPWSNLKAMMTTKYCPATKIQNMEQELWTLTLKVDDIEAYNNHFRNLPMCDHCNSHHNGQCLPKCRKCQRSGHQEKGCRVRLPGAGVTPLQDVTCYECGEKGHFKDKCPKGRNRQNAGTRARAYVVVENPQQNPNVVAGLPPVREIEFCIDLISGAFPVVKSPYRLAPSEMLDLSNQLKELQEKGFIRPSHSQ
nr:hypothetical protein [Tanacetum cinerariifolium]